MAIVAASWDIGGMRRIILALVVCLGLSASAHAELTVDDAKKDLEAGQYRQCLQKVSKLLVARTAQQDSPDRYDLLLMRGECLLQMKQASGAEAAFNSASSVMKSQADV